MRINRGLLGWAVFLLLVGAVPLLVRGGYASEDQVRSLESLWPLVLVGIGIAVILGRTRFAVLGSLLVAATFGLIVGALLSGGIGAIGVNACGSGPGAVSFPTQSGAFSNSPASVDIERNCGATTITIGHGETWRVDGEDRDGIAPIIDTGETSLSVRSRDDHRGPFDLVGRQESWRITLPDSVHLDLNLELNAGSATMDLAGASLGRVELNLNAGATTMDLGSVATLGELQVGLNAGSLNLTLPNQSLTGSIEANAGSVQLCVPASAGLRLRTTESIVASYDYEGHGLVKSGTTWETPGFDSAEVRIELDTQANAGSFSLDPEDGCNG